MTQNMEPIRYIGKEFANIDYHDGQLKPVIGVQNYQVLRANHLHPEWAEDTGWTYNHAPMLAYWNRTFYLEYLSTPMAEHTPPGQTLLTTSADGIRWSKPKVVFPPYLVKYEAYKFHEKYGVHDDIYAVMHQRMGFYLAPDNRLLALGFYGISPNPEILPFDDRGIGRVVREIYPDNSFGPIYFIRYNVQAGWNQHNTNYPFYKESSDEGFKEACDKLLADRLVTQQWLEEGGESDELVTVKGPYEAFCYYHIADSQTVVGLWKWSKAAISQDNGKTWSDVMNTPSIAHAGGKIWGQAASDGTYVLCYNPSKDNKHRWPLALVVGTDGINFDNLSTINGEVPPRRYGGGNFKDYGLNYVRGIAENNGIPDDGDVWIAYSMNKEDIWVSRIPVPIRNKAADYVNDDFNDMECGGEVIDWNIYSPLWARVSVVDFPDAHNKSIELQDMDPYDYAKAERVFPESGKAAIRFKVLSKQQSHGQLYIDVADKRGLVPVRIIFDSDGYLKVCHGRKKDSVMKYRADTWYEIEIIIDAIKHTFNVLLNGESLSTGQRYQGKASNINEWYFRGTVVPSVERIIFRTGPARKIPDVDTPVEIKEDIPQSEIPVETAYYYINYLSVSDISE